MVAESAASTGSSEVPQEQIYFTMDHVDYLLYYRHFAEARTQIRFLEQRKVEIVDALKLRLEICNIAETGLRAIEKGTSEDEAVSSANELVKVLRDFEKVHSSAKKSSPTPALSYPDNWFMFGLSVRKFAALAYIRKHEDAESLSESFEVSLYRKAVKSLFDSVTLKSQDDKEGKEHTLKRMRETLMDIFKEEGTNKVDETKLKALINEDSLESFKQTFESTLKSLESRNLPVPFLIRHYQAHGVTGSRDVPKDTWDGSKGGKKDARTGAASSLLPTPGTPQKPWNKDLPHGDSVSTPLGDGGSATKGAGSTTASKRDGKRKRWSKDEEEALVAGVKKRGVGKWAEILRDDEFQFETRRTSIDLKDKWRNLCKKDKEGLLMQEYGLSDRKRSTASSSAAVAAAAAATGAAATAATSHAPEGSTNKSTDGDDV